MILRAHKYAGGIHNSEGKMNSNSLIRSNKTWLASAVLCTALIFGGVTLAQAPAVDIDHHAHSNLANAQKSIVDAYHSIEEAQKANKEQLGGHAQRAKDLLMQANEELRQAANVANAEGR
jgi:hypothetical protein